MKKNITLAFAALMLCFTMHSTAYTDILETSRFAVIDEIESSESVARTEETEWFYRTINGVREKRLWSYTYNKWLTDWMPC